MERIEPYLDDQHWMGTNVPIEKLDSRDHNSYHRKPQRGEQALTNEERRFMLNAERGDCASVAKNIEEYNVGKGGVFDINCMDQLG
jgi:hypothetical protein